MDVPLADSLIDFALLSPLISFSAKEEGVKESMMNGKVEDDDDDVVPLDRCVA